MNLTLTACAALTIAFFSAIGGPDLKPHLLGGGRAVQTAPSVAAERVAVRCLVLRDETQSVRRVAGSS